MKFLLFFVPRFLTHYRVLEKSNIPNSFRAVPFSQKHKKMKVIPVTKLKVFTFLGFIYVLSVKSFNYENPYITNVE